MTDVLDRLRDRDPAAHVRAEPPAHLLAQITDTPRATSARGFPRLGRPAQLAFGATAVAAIAAVLAVALGGGSSLDLTARAYAQTSASDHVLHVITDTRTRSTDATVPTQDTRNEWWTHEREAHAVYRTEQNGKQFSYDQLLGNDGVVHNRMTGPNGVEEQTFGEAEGAEGEAVVAALREGFVARFRQAYEKGELDPSGTTTFSGRRAQRYNVQDRESVASYFLDAETGAPLGWVQTLTMYAPKMVNGKPQIVDGRPVRGEQQTMTITETVERIEQLPVDAESLAAVRTRR